MNIRNDGAADGRANMDADAALLAAAERGVPGGRVYSWSGVWVSLGRFQSAERDLIDPGHTAWVLRPTGGKAVLHGHDATVGLGLPLAMLDADPRSIRSVYRAVVRPLVAALNACGLPAALADDTRHAQRGARTADCFAFTSPNDIVDPTTGRKVCGCALRVTDRAVLLQASVPAGIPTVPPERLIRNALPAEPPPHWQSADLAAALRETFCAART
jgi:lipoate-protein ligase A